MEKYSLTRIGPDILKDSWKDCDLLLNLLTATLFVVVY